MKKRLLVLENGRHFLGDSFGADGTVVCEIVFNTQMVGYQEIITDPSYYGQMVVMSYPLIGNYGLTDDDNENHGVYLGGLIVREYNDQPSNFRASKTLAQEMEDNGVVGLSGIDTRELVQIIRDEGSMKAMLTSGDRDVNECLKELKEAKLPKDEVKTVSSKRMWNARTRNPEFSVAVIDCGMVFDIIKNLNVCGCNVIVFPFDAKPEEIAAYKPDGLLVSSGPGSPESVKNVAKTAEYFIGKIPVAGIGLGFQLIALTYGCKIAKKKFGHHGANQSVKNLLTDKIEITVQNHSYEIDEKSIEKTALKPTHINLTDGEVEAARDDEKKVVGVEFMPAVFSKVEDSNYLFDTFIQYMKSCGGKKNAKENRY